jgi:LPS-assembly protein
MLPAARPAPLPVACASDRSRRIRHAILLGTPLAALMFAVSPAAARMLPRGIDDGLSTPITTGGGIAPDPQTPVPVQTSGPKQAIADDGKTDQNNVPINFEADRIEYQDDTDIAVARGNVVLKREDQSVRADTVTWNRKTGQILATGNVRVVDRDGNQLYTDKVELTDEFKAGAIENFLLTFREGGRLAARNGRRLADGKVLLGRAAYTGCDVVDARGCDTSPSWHITARRVTYDPDRKVVAFEGARLVLFGIHLGPLPKTYIATDGRAMSGLMIPNFRLSASNGLEVDETYYYRISNNRDIAATAYVFSKVAPMASFQYRALTGSGAYQITGYATSSAFIPTETGSVATGSDSFRGYLDINGRFQLSPEWSTTFSGRLASDRTFLRRYYINGDDELRSTANIEHIDKDSFFSIAGWAFQTLRTDETQGQVPIALPEIDYRRRIADPWLGGMFELQANSLAITRTEGQDTQRAFVSARWDLRKVTGMGQVVTLTGLLRGDLYHTDNGDLTPIAAYRGNPGWQTRGVATAAVDVTWPLLGNALGGTQVVTPHIQLVATPSVPNLAIPNEDSRALELEDDNLFALNRFPGYDRVEDGVRMTYGLDYQLEIPKWRVNATIGQSYRFSNDSSLFPAGTGLDDHLSDIVGRIEVSYRDFFKVTHRFRLDKDNFTFRRNEIDATIGSQQTYFEIGYSRLNRQFAASLEDLQDSDELRAAARVHFARYWSMFGSGIFDLAEDIIPGETTAKPFQPLRTRLGISYQSDCLELSFTWRRDFVTIGDASKGNSFQLHLSLKNIGFN